MKGRYFKIDDLLELTAGKLQENTPLLDISSSTISAVLSTYKEKYNPKKRKQTPVEENKPAGKSTRQTKELLPAEIKTVRQMIMWFENRQKRELADFEELKSALADIGMDYQKVLTQFRKQKKSRRK